MTSNAQRAQLQAQIWKIANEVRGAVDGWDFKQFVLGTLFYRFISENFTNYIEGGDESVDYASMSYVEAKETRQETDIKELNERIRKIVERENELRAEIDEIIKELEEDEL